MDLRLQNLRPVLWLGLWHLEHMCIIICNLATNTLRAYLGTQPSTFWAFMIRKTAQKSHERQLNTEVCSSGSAILLIVSFVNQNISRMA